MIGRQPAHSLLRDAEFFQLLGDVRNPFSACLRGRPRGRNVIARPRRRAGRSNYALLPMDCRDSRNDATHPPPAPLQAAAPISTSRADIARARHSESVASNNWKSNLFEIIWTSLGRHLNHENNGNCCGGLLRPVANCVSTSSAKAVVIVRATSSSWLCAATNA